MVSQTYIGSPARVLSLATGQGQETVQLKVEEFGALWRAQQLGQDIDLCAIIDKVIPAGDREKGPTIGEYFLYGIWNRMMEAVSKNKLANWYKRTAIQHIPPVDISELTSKQYWEKWDRVTEDLIVGRCKTGSVSAIMMIW